MGTYQAQFSRIIDGEANLVYQILADYHSGHPNILPKEYFKKLTVEQGGIGDGTVIFVEMKMLGMSQNLRLFISEPIPGRELQEEDPDEGVVTVFKVEPGPNNSQCKVTIHTDWKRKKGLQGWLEQRFYPRIARHIYNKELALLQDYCAIRNK